MQENNESKNGGALRGSQAAKYGAAIYGVLPSGWAQITCSFAKSEAWMLESVIRDLSGKAFGQTERDAVPFALLDLFGGLAVIRPRHQLKLSADK